MESAETLLAQVSHSLQFVREYPSAQGRTLQVRNAEGRDLVLKVLAAGDDATEVSVTASVQHPCIPRTHEVGRLADGRAFILRDHVDGQAQTSLPRTSATLRPILQQLLEVVAFLHLRGIVHLDLKPANLVVDAEGHVHLLDFGMAVRTGSRSHGGTPFFAAPEVLFGTIADYRADLFSIGAMVVQALVPASRLDIPGFVHRFPAESFMAACGLTAKDLPAPYATFVAACVARQPSRRFPDADAAIAALCGVGGGRPSAASLAPDPVQLFAAELPSTIDNAHDVRLHGSHRDDRRAIALHLAAMLPGVSQVSENDDATVLHRDGQVGTTISLPPLDAERLHPHLQATLGLDGDALIQAADHLLAAGRTGAAVAQSLRALLESGQLLPSGTRWTWPQARSGRLAQAGRGETEDHILASPEQVRQAAATGRFDHARALWQRANERDEPAMRTALVEGLLDGGEPARALPLCADLPVLRAQALVNTGHFALAARELAALGTATAGRHRRVAATLAMASGDKARARSLLIAAATDTSKASLADRLTLAAVLEQCGELDACEQLLEQCLGQIDTDQEPYATASLYTLYGHVARQRQDLDKARGHFEQAVQMAQRIGHMRHVASNQLNLGVVAKDSGNHREAAMRFREANNLYEHVGDTGRAAIARANLGIAALARDDIETARSVLTEVIPHLQSLGDTQSARLALVMLARAHASAGDTAKAEAALHTLGEPDTLRLQQEFTRVQEQLQRNASLGNDEGMTDGREAQQASRTLFRTFLAVNRKLAQVTDVEDAMRTLLDAAVTLSGGRDGYLLVMREDGMRREFQSGEAPAHARAFSRSLVNRAMQEQRTLTGVDVLADEELQAMQSVKNLAVRSAICTPFHSAAGTTGAIYVEHPGRAGVFDEHDKEALEMLADQAAIAVDRMLREEATRLELSRSKRDLVIAKRAMRREATRLLGDSPVMQSLRTEIDKLANLDLSILIQGETGTGKELVARALHDRGIRGHGPFVAENCSALPAELIERELFGHVEGAFTGADRDRPGLLELASGGTLFLDEVGDMSPAVQAKLLRALQEQAIRRVGGSEMIELDLRVVAATHKDLRAMVQAEQFREDLFFRLAGVELRVPPLRERTEDITLLADHFVERHSRELGVDLRLSKAAHATLTSYEWPGNVRELGHVIARATLLCDGDEIVDLQLPQAMSPPAGTPTATHAEASNSKVAHAETEALTLKDVERRAIAGALTRFGGDKTKTARALGISRTALYDKIKRHDLGD